MNFETKKFENIVVSILFGCIVIVPLYILEYLYVYKVHNLTIINDDLLVITYNILQISIIAVAHYVLFNKGK